jgi:hypothetical protein
VSDDNLDALRQDKARAWIYEDSQKPITKSEGRDIVKAINQIDYAITAKGPDIVNAIKQIDDRIYHFIRNIPVNPGIETNKLLAAIKNDLNVIKWGVGIIAVLVASKLLFG